MEFLIMLLLLIVPGYIAALIFQLISQCNISIILKGLIFDLFIFIINIFGLYYFKGIHTVEKLAWYFNCLHFTMKYALLSILVAIILGLIGGLIGRIICRRLQIGTETES